LWKIFQYLVQRLCLPLVSFSEADELMAAELTYSISVENIVLSNFPKSAGRVGGYLSNLYEAAEDRDENRD
jgi:hypothetical protein